MPGLVRKPEGGRGEGSDGGKGLVGREEWHVSQPEASDLLGRRDVSTRVNAVTDSVMVRPLVSGSPWSSAGSAGQSLVFHSFSISCKSHTHEQYSSSVTINGFCEIEVEMDHILYWVSTD